MLLLMGLIMRKREGKHRANMETIVEKQSWEIDALKAEQLCHQWPSHPSSAPSSSSPVMMAIPVTEEPATAFAVPIAQAEAPTRCGRRSPKAVYLKLLANHDVDENSEIMIRHNIIRVRKGERVRLVKGTFSRGLGGAYSEYIEVRRSDGRVGKINRKIVAVWSCWTL